MSLFVARSRLFLDPHTGSVSILLNEDHSGLLERAPNCINGHIARFSTSLELPNGHKTNVRGGSELLLRPIDKSASSTALIALTIQGLRHIGTWRFRGLPTGRAAVVVLVLANLVAASAQGWEYWDAHRTGWWVDRENMIRDLSASGGKHLVIVRYADNHPPFAEWIFNAANIDASPVIWAREI